MLPAKVLFYPSARLNLPRPRLASGKVFMFNRAYEKPTYSFFSVSAGFVFAIIMISHKADSKAMANLIHKARK